MSIKLKSFLFVIWIMIFIYFIKIAKAKKTDVRYILPWLMLDVALCAVTAFPNILVSASSLFGIEMPSNMLFFFGIIFLAAINFYSTVSIAKMNNNIKELSQELALLKNRIHSFDVK